MPRFSSMILGAFIFRTAITVVLPAGAATEFRAAASKTDITPADSAIMWGYSDRSGPATGTHDRSMPEFSFLMTAPSALRGSRSTSAGLSAMSR